MAKMFEDAFRAFGILQDDSPKFVNKSILEVIEIRGKKGEKSMDEKRSRISKEDEDYVEIDIIQSIIKN